MSQEQEMSPDQEPSGGDERERLAAILDGVRSGVRQRQSELATLEEAREEIRLALAELRSSEVLEEPLCVSSRPVVGRILVFLRKGFFHLFGKWYARPMAEQQNRHNRVSGRLHEELASYQERQATALEGLERRLAALEEAASGGVSPDHEASPGRETSSDHEVGG